MSQPQPLRPVYTYSPQNDRSLVEGGWSCICSLAHSPMHRRLPGAFFLHMSKPHFSSLGGVFSDIKNNFFFSFYVCVYSHATVSSVPACHTDTISLLLPLSSSPLDRAAACPGFEGAGERWVVLFFSCATLLPFTGKQFLHAVSRGHAAALAWSCPGYLVWARVQH